MSTYVDAVGRMSDWINAQSTDLVGPGNPLQHGAHFQYLRGATPAVFALIEELPGRTSDDSPEDPDMMAVLSFQVYGTNGVTRKAATAGAVALAEALGSLKGMPAVVPGAVLWVADDVQGPYWAPDGDTPRLILQATIRMRPA